MKSLTGKASNMTAHTYTADVFSQISAAFRLTDEEKEKLRNSATASLIASLPFIAGCDDAERTALTHLSVYILSLRGARFAFDHAAADDKDIYARLRCISGFSGGNEKIIRRGMDMLALQMLCGYERDRAKDAASGEYNPLNSGAWDFVPLKTSLEDAIRATECPQLEKIMPLSMIPYVYWS